MHNKYINISISNFSRQRPSQFAAAWQRIHRRSQRMMSHISPSALLRPFRPAGVAATQTAPTQNVHTNIEREG